MWSIWAPLSISVISPDKMRFMSTSLRMWPYCVRICIILLLLIFCFMFVCFFFVHFLSLICSYFHCRLEFSLFAFSIYYVFFFSERVCLCVCIVVQFSFVYLTKYCAHSNIFTHTVLQKPFLIVEWSVKFQYFVVVVASFKIHHLTFWP